MIADAVATEIRLDRAARVLYVTFGETGSVALPAEYLRVESPSAEVQGHGRDGKKTVGGKSAVNITAVEPVGNYAVRLVFDDGHDTGIFTWSYLSQIGHEYPTRWAGYLAALAAKGLAR